ncbi:DUF2256 domain-containing protein [Mucilaginibacter sp. SP1R1]|uniref:DUF2256 domain-containing protein n=1 Tax=Mucilaginibacter sp. SP1R1 TaxID=2723091 RepID=UPI0016171087|nr:DUF2256 domain-containing protein [Mucilaginibacter sp. SP1R1]MBB6152372.1 hypothetical protein [Mucilaginibacter sp. SP1R1]
MKGVKKQDLPQKICITCDRSFTWRKKWQKVWHDVKYWLDRCSRHSGAIDRYVPE